MFIKKIILLLIADLTLSITTYAQDGLTKQDKAAIRSLKKQYKVECIERHYHNGFTFFELYTKDSKRMIANSEGKVIIPKSGMNTDGYKYPVKFIPEHKRGMGPFKIKWETSTIVAYYTGNARTFLAYRDIENEANEYTFFSETGELVSSFVGRLTEDTNLPVFITNDLLGHWGIMSLDGKTILPNEYVSVETAPDGFCKITKMYNDVERTGGICITGETTVSVPCIFNSVKYSSADGGWLVRIHEFDPYIIYDESVIYDLSYQDEGEKLFEQRRFNDVRKYYSLKGRELAQSDFFIGASYYKDIQDLYDDAQKDLSTLEKSQFSQDRSLATDISDYIARIKYEAKLATDSFRTYLAKDDKKYEEQTKEILYEIKDIEASVNRLDSRLSMAVADFEMRCIEADRRRQEEYDRQLEQRRIELEHQRLNAERVAREQKEREERNWQRVNTAIARSQSTQKGENKDKQEQKQAIQQQIQQSSRARSNWTVESRSHGQTQSTAQSKGTSKTQHKQTDTQESQRSAKSN